ncbi:MAG TPA: leucine--tRNA ligase [Caldisericia bacterium]|nr:leucine--tRNA ligase [Caldisericia bacterium]
MRKDIYDFKKIEGKWQIIWEKESLYEVKEDNSKKKFYILDMFPYPSAEGLHVGHPEGYTASDIIARKRMMEGLNVLHPMGWDAFGLPTENYALKMKIHPKIATANNINNFKRQIKRFGFSYDWSREINTSDPSYYKWTQWIFLKMYENGLAYEADIPINWCPSCKTGLANEEVIQGICERCGTKIERRNMRQWMLKITAYADRLLEDLDLLDWPEKIVTMQKNWIGRSEGVEIDFKIKDTNKTIKVFTTRPDTIFGATYLVLAPEHPILSELLTGTERENLDEYINRIKSRSDLERTSLIKEKEGIFTNLFAINPANGQVLPIYVADYVLLTYGTGAIMAVPAHDQRDFEFAVKYNLPVVQVIKPDSVGNSLNEAYEGEGIMINSSQFNNTNSIEARKAITDYLEKMGVGKKVVKYKLRDWVFSRQRFWGEPIPIVHCEKCGAVPLPYDELPLTLPDVPYYETSGTGESPLALIEDWVNVNCPKCGGKAKRETNTMPQWAGSCWYYIRYVDPKNDSELANKDKINYWLPVDLYIGGAEHAVLHLLYARFWHKFLFDIGEVNTPEPFIKLRNQGLVLAEDGRKMSKSLGNVINPDDVIDKYGADVIRMYEMFMGPFDQDTMWSTEGVEGIRRFINKVWSLFDETEINEESPDDDTLRIMHKTIKKVSIDIENFSFNTAISSLMIYVNNLLKLSKRPKVTLENLTLLLAPFAPHMSEELWSFLGHSSSIFKEKWPEYIDELSKDKILEVPIQVNGKLRSKLFVSKEITEEEIKNLALIDDKVKSYTEGKNIKKVIYVKNKLLNIVTD